MNDRKIRAIALYLPQFHPTPENDRVWGKGFTEWTNVVKAKPLFRGHVQPRIPTDTGFYDLRLDETRELQVELARTAGIEGFCYWHYWFGNGLEVLQRPFDEVVESKHPDFPFCLGWAIHDWTTKTWEKGKSFSHSEMIFKQEFPGEEDDIKHFYRLLKAFRDERYIKVDGKLLFVILDPKKMPNVQSFLKLWNNLAVQNGLPGFHFVASAPPIEELKMSKIRDIDKLIDEQIDYYIRLGFDAVQPVNNKIAELRAKGLISKAINALIRRISPGIVVDKFKYKDVMKYWFTPSDSRENVYPQVLVGWDRTPRAGRKAIIYYEDSPKEFGKVLNELCQIEEKKEFEHRIVFFDSWNEWGEGAYLEPDMRYGKGKLMELQKYIFGEQKSGNN